MYMEKSGNAVEMEFIVVDIMGLVSSGVDEFLRGFLYKRTQQRPSQQNDVKDWTKEYSG